MNIMVITGPESLGKSAFLGRIENQFQQKKLILDADEVNAELLIKMPLKPVVFLILKNIEKMDDINHCIKYLLKNFRGKQKRLIIGVEDGDTLKKLRQLLPKKAAYLVPTPDKEHGFELEHAGKRYQMKNKVNNNDKK